MKYAYPAVFVREEDGKYSIRFPDIPGCVTSGNSIADGISMAEDALAFMLYDYEVDGEQVPEPSTADKIEIPANGFVNYISADTMEYRKRFNKKAVKKTLTIPEWLNELALEANLNFSQLLQDAIVEKLRV